MGRTETRSASSAVNRISSIFKRVLEGGAPCGGWSSLFCNLSKLLEVMCAIASRLSAVF
jgi:hypothetical protein